MLNIPAGVCIQGIYINSSEKESVTTNTYFSNKGINCPLTQLVYVIYLILQRVSTKYCHLQANNIQFIKSSVPCILRYCILRTLG
jgi:hypothetical protein